MAIPAIHPGEHLAEELKALNMSAAELARRLKVPTNRITEIMNGQRSITGCIFRPKSATISGFIPATLSGPFRPPTSSAGYLLF